MPSQRLREVRLRLPVDWYEAIREVAKKEGISTQLAIEALIAAGLEAGKQRPVRHMIAVPEPEATQ